MSLAELRHSSRVGAECNCNLVLRHGAPPRDGRTSVTLGVTIRRQAERSGQQRLKRRPLRRLGRCRLDLRGTERGAQDGPVPLPFEMEVRPGGEAA